MASHCRPQPLLAIPANDLPHRGRGTSSTFKSLVNCYRYLSCRSKGPIPCQGKTEKLFVIPILWDEVRVRTHLRVLCASLSSYRRCIARSKGIGLPESRPWHL